MVRRGKEGRANWVGLVRKFGSSGGFGQVDWVACVGLAVGCLGWLCALGELGGSDPPFRDGGPEEGP